MSTQSSPSWLSIAIRDIRLFFYASAFMFWFNYTASRFLNFLFGKGWDVKVVRATSLSEARDMMHNVSYEYDTGMIFGRKFKHFWMKPAGYVQKCLDEGKKAKGDCDEFASYGAEIILDCPGVVDSYIMTIRWETEDGVHAGHNIGLYRYVRKDGMLGWGHIGNWGLHEGFSSPMGVALSIGRGGGGRLIAFAMCDKDHRMLAHVRTV